MQNTYERVAVESGAASKYKSPARGFFLPEVLSPFFLCK